MSSKAFVRATRPSLLMYPISETSCARKIIGLTSSSSLKEVNRTGIPFFGYTSAAATTG